jgi:hypothetical protein
MGGRQPAVALVCLAQLQLLVEELQYGSLLLLPSQLQHLLLQTLKCLAQLQLLVEELQ